MFDTDDAVDAVRVDRAVLASCLADDIEFIAIVEGSQSAITPPMLRMRLLLLEEIVGQTPEEKIADARRQMHMKMQPWERPHVLYRLAREAIK